MILCYLQSQFSQPLESGLLTSVCLGIALSACCGFRVFIPLLAASIAGYNHLIHLPADMQWLAGLPAMICFGTAALIEICAYYIPFLDNILDTVSTPLAFLAGSSLAASLLPIAENEPLIRWSVGAVTGGLTAGTIQAGTGLLRLFTTKATVGTGNVVVASGENVAAVTGTVLSFMIPVVVAIVLLTVVSWLVYRTVRRWIKREGAVY